MKIKSLKINNYKCFESYEVSFAHNVTIVIGRNGAGKSTLLNALKMALSFIFSSNRSLGKDFLSAGNPSLNVRSFADNDYRYTDKSGTTSPDAAVSATATYNGEQLEWELYKRSTSNASLYTSKYKDAFETFMHEWKDNNADLPLIACFSDSFPHKGTKQTKFAMDSIQKDRIPRNFGYYQWDLDTAFTSIWETRLCNQLVRIAPSVTKVTMINSSLRDLELEYTPEQLESNESYKNLKAERERIVSMSAITQEEIFFVRDKLAEFSQKLPKLNEEEYYIDYLFAGNTDLGYELNLMFKNGKGMLLKELPAGYRRLYSIVLDLAYRAYILNQKEPSGIVVIDEIDLHLHPSLEQEVVRCLCETFPNLQFILSTHSAAVISNLNTSETYHDEATGLDLSANKILFMQEGQSEAETLPNIYGLDYNAALRDFMDTPSRSSEIKQLGDEYLTYCSLGLAEEASSIFKKLVESLGSEDHPFIKELKEKSKAYEVH